MDNIGFVLANSADPDEMLHYATFHKGLHYLQKSHAEISNMTRSLRINRSLYHLLNCVNIRLWRVYLLPDNASTVLPGLT